MAVDKSKVEAIFYEALGTPVDQRAAVLDNSCGQDLLLRQRVESLLTAHDNASGFLTMPDPAPPTSTPEVIGTRIGRYTLVQLIGEGGFGDVYLAEQEVPLRRQVAIKVIKLGMDTRQVIARFEAERQALAMMNHPNIAKVLDAGATDAGRPYFVMELIHGVPITQYCDDQKLNTRQRIELFIQVCHGIQHAHQNGVIHRDIKPNNVLVTIHDDKPVPKVIDFGIAKATNQRLTEKTLFTDLQQFIGTPAYMSPEQAQMSGQDVDTRSDIYSLGVLLYELLTGTTPFDRRELQSAAYGEIQRIIREVEPPRPSTRLGKLDQETSTAVAQQRRSDIKHLSRTLKGDLDWIVMKCLEKIRAHRYETADGLALDAERYLNSEVISARPPSNLYRFRKLIRRNKLAFAVATVVIASLLIGLGVSSWSLVKQHQAFRQAETNRKQAEQVAQFLEDMLQGVGPSAALGRDTTLLREILDKTVQRVGTDLAEQPAVEAQLRNTIGRVYFAIGQWQQAEAMDRRTLTLRQTLYGNQSLQAATSLSNLADDLAEEHRYAEGEIAARAALAIQRQPPTAPLLDIASSLQHLAVTLNGQDKPGATEAYQEALAIRRKILGNDNRAVAISLMGVANMLWVQNKLPEAESTYREVLAIQQRIFGGEHPDMEVPLDNLANLLIAQGREADAEVVARRVLALQKKFLGDSHPHEMRSLGILTGILIQERKLDEAEDVIRQRLALQKQFSFSDNEDTVWIRSNLGDVARLKGKDAEAEAIYREVLPQMEKQFGHQSRGVVITLNQLANLLIKRDQLDEAEADDRQALAILKNLPASNEREDFIGWSREGLAQTCDLLEQSGRLAEAIAMRREFNLPTSQPASTRSAPSDSQP